MISAGETKIGVYQCPGVFFGTRIVKTPVDAATKGGTPTEADATKMIRDVCRSGEGRFVRFLSSAEALAYENIRQAQETASLRNLRR